MFGLNLNPFGYCTPLPLEGTNIDLNFEQQYLKNGKSRHCLYRTFLEEYLMSFMMTSTLIDFALMAFFFLSGFSFTTIHESHDCSRRGRAFL